ncbi:MAG: signal peptidase I [Candidatus Aenigmarchaeota archaeon]|nr:signal peptidase I [Candidatus Aenigmarchaeota archaeon]
MRLPLFLRPLLPLAVVAAAFQVVRFQFINGPSMEPALRDGELVLVNKRAPLSAIARGDIVMFRSPSDPSRVYVKRVAGLPGDAICQEGHPACRDPAHQRTVPPGAFFALGDNASVSYDSRQAGFIPVANLTGKVIGRLPGLLAMIAYGIMFCLVVGVLRSLRPG